MVRLIGRNINERSSPSRLRARSVKSTRCIHRLESTMVKSVNMLYNREIHSMRYKGSRPITIRYRTYNETYPL